MDGVCRLLLLEEEEEDRVIPAERRGSCCFLLGIVSVTFLGASHAGITGDSGLSVVKIHPARRCDGVLSSLWDPETSSLQSACSSSDLTGSASTAGRKFKKRLGRLPTPRCPSKIIFLHFLLTGTAEKKKKEAPSLQLTPTAKKKKGKKKKEAPDLLLCLVGDFAAPFTHAKATKMNQLWR